MASVWKHSKDKPSKASVLRKDEAKITRTERTRGKTKADKDKQSDMQDFVPLNAVAEKKIKLWADITALALIVLILVGAFVGYQILKRNAQTGEQTVQLEYRVVLQRVPQGMDVGGLVGQSLCLADESDGCVLGTITKVEQDGTWLCVTVKTDALYEKGKGYRIDTNRLIVGATATFQLGDASSYGRIVSLRQTA